MNILIVDDDQYVINGIHNGVSWDELPFSNRYEARSAAEARRIVERFPIEVLLCDIEMPQESGLSFLSWLRDNGYRGEAIFLTSYAKFDYAQQALRLGSFEYCLKPIEYDKLTDILRRVAENIQVNEAQRQYEKYGSFWLEEEDARKESFWAALMSPPAPLAPERIAQEIEKRHMDLAMREPVVLMALRLVPKLETDWRDDEMTQFRLRSQLESCLGYGMDATREASSCAVGLDALWKESNGVWFCVFRTEGEEKRLWLRLGKALSECRKRLRPLYGEISAYFSERTDATGIHGQALRIRQMMFNRVAYGDGIFFVTDFHPDAKIDLRFDTDAVGELLLTEDIDALHDYIARQIDEAGRQSALGEGAIRKLLVDWTQAVFMYLHRNRIEADKLFATRTFQDKYAQAIGNLDACEAYIRYLVDEAISYRKYSGEYDNVIWKIKNYIENHLEENLTRAGIAETVYLNPDYMSWLFKNREGLSLMKYIRNLRMEKAREYLLTSDLPVYSIAQKTGYPTSSYFAKQFKEFYGLGPNEYRRQKGRA